MDDLTSQQIQQTQSASVSPPSGFQEVSMTGCSTQALTNGGSKNVGIRNRRKAPPRKVVIHERTETEPADQDADTQSDELFEGGDIFGGQASPDDPEMAAEEPLPSGSRVTMEGSGGPSVEDLQRLSEALTGKMDVQSLLSHMIAANNSTSQQLALSTFPNAADLLQQVSNQSDLSQQMISAVAQQQLAALAAVAPFNPSTPDCSASPSLTGMHSLSSQQPSSSEQQSSSSGSSKLGQGSVRSSKRKLFETAGTQGEPMSNDERIEIEDLEQFAAMFKKQRIKFGFTQGDVGQALGRRYGTDFSQTTISRFEAMNLSFKNMCKLRPLLKEWLSDAERALANGASITELIESGAQEKKERAPPSNVSSLTEDSVTAQLLNSISACTTSLPPAVSPGAGTPLKKRRKRTNLDLQQRQVLDIVFKMNPRPSHEHMSELADQLKLERDVVRVWFCNRRQKMRKEDEGPSGSAPIDPALLQSILLAGGVGGDQLGEGGLDGFEGLEGDMGSPKRETSDSPALSTTSHDQSFS